MSIFFHQLQLFLVMSETRILRKESLGEGGSVTHQKLPKKYLTRGYDVLLSMLAMSCEFNAYPGI